MPTVDVAKSIKDALAQAWLVMPTQPIAPPTLNKVTCTLHVDDDYQPSREEATLLIANDGGPAIVSSAWLLRKMPRRLTVRLTAFARNRSDARFVVDASVDWLIKDHNHASAGVSRIEDVSDQLITRDRATGAYLASITMPVIVRPV